MVAKVAVKIGAKVRTDVCGKVGTMDVVTGDANIGGPEVWRAGWCEGKLV